MTSFAHDIAPLFREKDVTAMKWMLDLTSYADVKANAEGILETVEDGSMPCDEAWQPDRVEAFRSWMSEDFPE